MNMRRVQRKLANDTLYRRIDELPMSTTDRRIAKAQLRDADDFVDGVFSLVAAMRSTAARVSRHVRLALTASPQH
jgi:hypothetical protein